MHQQLLVAIGVVHVGPAGAVLADVQAEQPQLVVDDAGVGIGDGHLRLAKRLDLGPFEHHPALVGIAQFVFMTGAPIGRDNARLALLALLCHGC